MKIRSWRYFIVLIWTLACVDTAHAVFPTTFPVRAKVALCPEYPLGGVTAEIHYTLGTDATVYTPTINSTTFNTSDNSVTYELLLPSTWGKTPIHVMAYCKSARGLSDASNILSVTNCDNLALYDTDGDGLKNNVEDVNCDNSFSPGDTSNPDNVDTDGDGIRDEVEGIQGTDPTNPGSSPRPMIFASAPFNPDGDAQGNSNAVVWRPANGTWYIRDFGTVGNHIAVPFGLQGDIPFTYKPRNATSNVGAIRNIGGQLTWYFNGGFSLANNTTINSLQFGIFGDNIVSGPWESNAFTSPAVARLYNGNWYFYIYKRDGSIQQAIWGGNGDIPKVQDYDGDGIFDVAVFRPSEQKTYIIPSSGGGAQIYHFGTGTADHTVRGDITGDGTDDISFWEPISGLFTSLTSDNGFNDVAGLAKDPNHYKQLQLGLYNVHVPLSWNRKSGKVLFTVIDHSTGQRFTRENNNQSKPAVAVQWGLPGDAQG